MRGLTSLTAARRSAAARIYCSYSRSDASRAARDAARAPKILPTMPAPIPPSANANPAMYLLLPLVHKIGRRHFRLAFRRQAILAHRLARHDPASALLA